VKTAASAGQTVAADYLFESVASPGHLVNNSNPQLQYVKSRITRLKKAVLSKGHGCA
jgi:hypothetical protein